MSQNRLRLSDFVGETVFIRLSSKVNNTFWDPLDFVGFSSKYFF